MISQDQWLQLKENERYGMIVQLMVKVDRLEDQVKDCVHILTKLATEKVRK